jgi:hypothetical protein
VSYQAVLTYHPRVSRFTNRSAWRVVLCAPLYMDPRPAVIDYYAGDGAIAVKALRMPVPRRLVAGTWTNPTKLLRELFARQRIARLAREQVRAIEADIFSTKEKAA